MMWAKSLEILSSNLLLLAQAAADEAPPPDAAAEAAGQPQSFLSFLLSPLNLILMLMMLFYIMVLSPQQRQMRSQQRALTDALSNLKKNDRVVTTGGIHGTVVQTSPEAGTITIRIDDSTGAKLTLSKEAISRIVDSEAKTASKPA